MTQRKAILVLGMYRSGTGVLTKMFSLLGCDLPKTSIVDAETDTHDHWESSAIRDLNTEILESASSTWDDWQEFDRQWYETPAYREFLKRGLEVLREDYGTSSFFVLNDPRNCRLARFWFAVLEKAQVEPLVAIPLRDPLEVAVSLARRDDIHPDTALLIWLRHVLDAEQSSRGRRRVFTTYDDLLADWSGVAERVGKDLGITWPRSSPRADKELEDLLDRGIGQYPDTDPELISNPTLSEWVQEINAVFVAWAATGEKADDYPILDKVLAQFNAVSPAFAGLRQDLARERSQLQDLQAVLSAKEETLAHLTDEVATLRGVPGDRAEDQRRAPSNSGEPQTVKTSADEPRAQSGSSGNRTDARKAELGAPGKAASANVAATIADRGASAQRDAAPGAPERGKAPLQGATAQDPESPKAQAPSQSRANEIAHKRETQTLNTALHATQREIEDLRTRVRDRQHAVDLAQNTLRQRDEEIFQTLASLKQESERNAELEAQRRLAEDALAATEAKLKDANEWVFKLAGERRAAELRASSAEARLAKAQSALSSSTARLANLESQRQHDVAEKDTLRRLNADLESLAEDLRGEREEVAERWTTAQTELATLSMLLRQKETEQQPSPAQPAGQMDSLAHRNEVAALAGRLHVKEAEVDRAARQAEWLQKVSAVVTSYPNWWSFAPKGLRREWQHQRLFRKGLFDASTYLARYPDVVEAGVDPLRHYITHGLAEDRTFD